MKNRLIIIEKSKAIKFNRNRIVLPFEELFLFDIIIPYLQDKNVNRNKM